MVFDSAKMHTHVCTYMGVDHFGSVWLWERLVFYALNLIKKSWV